jgi:starch synthase
MRVLFVTSECFPLIKTGGLADVAGALPLALARQGVDVRVLLPAYPGVPERLDGAQPTAAVQDLFGGDARLIGGRTADGLGVLALDAPHLYDRPANPYLGPDGRDWPDNHRRFAALSWTAAALAGGRLPVGWQPDLVHAHDWQAGLTPAYLRFHADTRPPSVFTVHNLAFQGLFPRTVLAELHLPPSSFTAAGLEFYDQVGFLKAGLVYADRLTTVSPTYAREICTAEHGMGLDGVLRGRADVLTGIVNGIDAEIWNPATDPHSAAPYSVRRLSAKASNKKALAAALGFDDDDGPLFCVVSRLTVQKGLDLLLEALPALLEGGGRLAMLVAGDPDLEAAYAAAERAHPNRVRVVFGYDEPLSHRLQAGADMIIVPSRFEPCGLTQLYGLRYGTLPIVARTGGLADTVIDANEAALRDGVATGFQFAPVTADALVIALQRALALYRDRSRFQAVQRRAMTRTVDWSAPAAAYRALYSGLVSPRSG